MWIKAYTPIFDPAGSEYTQVLNFNLFGHRFHGPDQSEKSHSLSGCQDQPFRAATSVSEQVVLSQPRPVRRAAKAVHSTINRPKAALAQFPIRAPWQSSDTPLPAVRRFDPNSAWRPAMADASDVAGTAALAICESLLLALNDSHILPEKEILGVLRDAAAAHDNHPGGDGKATLHAAVSALINSIIDGGNSVRRPD